MSSLEKDFNKLSEQVNAKLQKATKILKEMNSLIKKAGYEDFMDFLESENQYDELTYDELFKQLDEAGWHSSSLMC